MALADGASRGCVDCAVIGGVPVRLMGHGMLLSRNKNGLVRSKKLDLYTASDA